MEELAIMDYSTSEIYIYKVQIDKDINEEYIRDLGHNPDECSWMFGEYIKVSRYNAEEDY